MQHRNFAGEMVEAPKDFRKIVLRLFNGEIVWSRTSKLHQIRYGSQEKSFTDDLEASKELGYCIRHYVECEGLLD